MKSTGKFSVSLVTKITRKSCNTPGLKWKKLSMSPVGKGAELSHAVSEYKSNMVSSL